MWYPLYAQLHTESSHFGWLDTVFSALLRAISTSHYILLLIKHFVFFFGEFLLCDCATMTDSSIFAFQTLWTLVHHFFELLYIR